MNFEEMKNACIVEVLKDIKAEVLAIGKYGEFRTLMPDTRLEAVLEIIDRKVNEVTDEED